MKASGSVEKTGKGLARRDQILLIVLGIAVFAWLATIPMRARMNRETERINRDIAEKTSAEKALQQLSQAEGAARQRVEQAPQDLPARLALADILFRLRKYPEALDTLRAAEAIDPRNAQPHTAMADVYDAMGQLDRVADELRLALQRDPDDLKAATLLAYKYISFGWNRQAKPLLQAALARHPNDTRLHIVYALASFQNTDYKEAEQHLLEARRLAPNDPAPIGPLIDVYRHGKRYQEALRLIDQVLPSFPDKIPLLVEKTQIYVEMQNPVAAIQTADQVLQVRPEDTQVLYMRGVAEKMLGRADAALRDLETVRARAPYEQSLLLLGQLYTQQGQKEKGAALITQYSQQKAASDALSRHTLRVASGPDDFQAHLALGRMYLMQGVFNRAVVELKRASELKPTHQEARSLLIQALRQGNRTVEADALASNPLAH